MSVSGSLRQGFQKYILPVVSTVMLLLGVGFFLEGSAKKAQHDTVTYQADWLDRVPLGTQLPAASLLLTSGPGTLQELLPGHWTLVLVSSRFMRNLLEYPSTLVNRFGAEKLNVVNVLFPSPQNELEARRYPKQPGVTVAIDHRGELAERLELPEAPPEGRNGLIWYLLLDPKGALRFSYPKPLAADAMRQLAERLIEGAPPYVVDPRHDAYLAGRAVPAFDIHRVGTPEAAAPWQSVAPSVATLIFLRAHCATCGMDTLLRQIERALALRGTDAPPLVAVFSAAFDAQDLDLRTRHLQVPLYRATRIVSEWEDRYASRFSDSTAAMVVEIAADHKIAGSDDFQHWITTLSQPSSSPVSLPAAAAPAGWTRVADGAGLVLSFVRAAQATEEGGLALLDARDHRLLIIEPSGQVKEVSGIGQGPTDVFYPMALSVQKNTAYVIDQDGAILRSVPIGPGGSSAVARMSNLSDSIAVFPDGAVYANSPRDGAIAIKVGPTGAIEQRLGDLLHVADGYPHRPNSASLRVPLSRAWLAPVGSDKFIAAFQFAPVIRMYSRSGHQLWETKLSEGGRPLMDATFWGEAGAPAATAVKSIDGIQFPVVIRSVTVDRANRVYVVAGDRKLRVFDEQGQLLRVVEPAELPSRGSIDAMTVSADDSLVVCSRRSCFQRSITTLIATGKALTTP